ncbi:nitrile hydratase subunit alpha [Comamonas sp. Y6]|uniref:nitrile hydratase n=1 Tax=Comamonas resistens TaxID=3046670 RepID=A0ABY8SQ91_9BURK|nr:nitrile hydratase subunit alpha [Comamonas resistens]MDL5035841.1 nitrile hydratase subunit alpha [Comamonas resistens]WHS65249.1 nitrile hydratase subunit alpha [Comamonas resistens]HBP0978961.1 nitrile hydratase subunit alpha [Pseudomonas aeruginosa]
MTATATKTLTNKDRALALKSVLEAKKIIPAGHMEKWAKHQKKDWNASNAARVVVRAWTDPEYRKLLLSDAQTAIEEYGYTGPQGEYTVVLEDTPDVHNIIVCTLCSCTHWPLLGIPPEWYKSFEYRARVVSEPRKVLTEMGTDVPEDVELRVWDTTAETRYIVLPMRPAYTEGWTEQELMKIVTKDVLIGVALI